MHVSHRKVESFGSRGRNGVRSVAHEVQPPVLHWLADETSELENVLFEDLTLLDYCTGGSESASKLCPNSVVRPCLDIGLRIADLWREAADISEWSLDVVAAFMRAAYGKGYCDALTEELPGALCADHGYRVPERPVSSNDSVTKP